MIAPLMVSRSTMAAQSRGSVNVFVQLLKDSTVDSEARQIHKTTHDRRDGFKGHLAFEPQTGLFTAAG